MVAIQTSKVKGIVIGALVTLMVVVIVLFMIPDSAAQKKFMEMLTWISSINKVYGTITLTILYAIAILLCFPGTIFNLAAGFLFGIWIGAAVTIIGCDLGATLAFILGRTLGKDWAQSQVAKNKKFSLLSMAVENNAWLIIFLVRLSPVLPFGLCNYLFGVTKVKFSSYWTATTAGLIPCTVAYTYLGSLMKGITDIYNEEEEQGNSTLLIVGIVLTIVGITVITLVTKRTLDKTIKQQQEKELLEMDKLQSDDKQPILSDYNESNDTMV